MRADLHLPYLGRLVTDLAAVAVAAVAVVAVAEGVAAAE